MAHDVKWEPDDVVVFGPFRLFPANRLLEKAGTPVRLGDRALDILLTLIGHAAEVVSNASLVAQVWPDLTVAENNLRVQVAKLRKALGDGEAGIRYIYTVPRRGYCFVSPISRLKMPARPPAFVPGQGDDPPARSPGWRAASRSGPKGSCDIIPTPRSNLRHPPRRKRPGLKPTCRSAWRP